MSVLVVSADLACPPSEVYAFRSFTFFAHKYCHYEILATVEDWEYRDTYWEWFKDHYLFDHVKDLIEETDIPDAVRLTEDRITCENLLSNLRTIGFTPPGKG